MNLNLLDSDWSY